MAKTKTSKGRKTQKTTHVSEATKTYVKKAISARKPMRTFTYVPYSGGDVTTTCNIDDLTAIAFAGAGVADDPEVYRSQQQIIPKKLLVSYSWEVDTTATVANQIRILIFRWKQERGEDAPEAADIFGDAITSYVRGFPFQDIDTTKGQILYDKYMTLPRQHDGAATLGTMDRKAGRFTLYLNKLPKIQYLSDAGTAGVNHIYLCVVGNAGAGINNSTLYMTTQLFYQE